jgi:hypothetical protein
VALKLVGIVHLRTQNLLHNIGFSAVFHRMFAPKNCCVVIIQIPCIVSLKCKIILIITSTYITSFIHRNVGFLAGAVSLKVAYSMTTVALDLRGTDKRLVPDLPRDRGRSIGGDLNVGEEGSEQTIVPLQSVHHSSVGY